MVKNLRSILLSALLPLTMLTSCGPKLSEGTISELVYEPPRTYVQLVPMHVGDVTMLMPYHFYDDADYVVTFQNKNSEGDLITRRVYVDSARFDTLKVGTYFCVDASCSFNDQPLRERISHEDFQKYSSEN